MSLKRSASQSGDFTIPPVGPAPHPAAVKSAPRKDAQDGDIKSIQRICHLVASREHGELEKHVADLSRWQAHNTNAQVSVIAHPRYQNTLDQKVNFIPLNTDRSRHHPTLIWRLANHIRAGGFQIAHGHGSKSAQLLAAVQKYTDARQVITRHNVRHPRDKLASAFDARIAVSRSAVANSRLDWNIIPNGIEVKWQASAPLDLQLSPEPKALVAARLIRLRGTEPLLQALNQVSGVQLIILGDGPEKNALEQQSRELKLDKRVIFVGRTDKASAFLRTADLLVILSRNESPPYALAEALQNRCPVIASREGDAEDYVPPEYLLDNLDPAHLAKKLRFALTNKDRLHKDFSTAFERAANELSLDNTARAIWRVYAQLVS
ncbi:glycosyltransferase family 4 protein [Microbulbifer thermotolerans]|uniref:Glycosyltransferase family 4 protein n=1 Tax=Microbulbifer thermotolerans TaxID=252514 RepID=A0AB35HYH7_MICTH|nr:glycosyltransferase family 4 protein [Microbulbifer thermotolerans]MCX2801847.1 glycosyltransferase family 4 protein [Microbulbifer thermotolerans]